MEEGVREPEAVKLAKYGRVDKTIMDGQKDHHEFMKKGRRVQIWDSGQNECFDGEKKWKELRNWDGFAWLTFWSKAFGSFGGFELNSNKSSKIW